MPRSFHNTDKYTWSLSRRTRLNEEIKLSLPNPHGGPTRTSIREHMLGTNNVAATRNPEWRLILIRRAFRRQSSKADAAMEYQIIEVVW
jgi:hypothetical protein